MGFFSWKTCDSKESISNVYSGRQVRTVYLLQPHGQKPLQGFGAHFSEKSNVSR